MLSFPSAMARTQAGSGMLPRRFVICSRPRRPGSYAAAQEIDEVTA